MGGGTKKATRKRQKRKASIRDRSAEIVTTAVSQCFMSLVASGGRGCRFSFSVHHRQKENATREKRAQSFCRVHLYIHIYIPRYLHIYTHTHKHIYTYIQIYIYTYLHIQSGSPGVAHSDGPCSTGATVRTDRSKEGGGN